jgi:Tfp pilus assembly protein PilZ
MNGMEEKRKFPRFDSSFQIKYSPKDKASRCSYTISDNISKGGLCMPALSRVINKDDTITLDINSGNRKKHILATGKVIWTRPINRVAVLDGKMGIEFTSVDSIEIDNLIKAINNRLFYQNLA